MERSLRRAGAPSDPRLPPRPARRGRGAGGVGESDGVRLGRRGRGMRRPGPLVPAGWRARGIGRRGALWELMRPDFRSSLATPSAHIRREGDGGSRRQARPAREGRGAGGVRPGRRGRGRGVLVRQARRCGSWRVFLARGSAVRRGVWRVRFGQSPTSWRPSPAAGPPRSSRRRMRPDSRSSGGRLSGGTSSARCGRGAGVRVRRVRSSGSPFSRPSYRDLGGSRSSCGPACPDFCSFGGTPPGVTPPGRR